MAAHASTLAWKIPWMGELVGCCLWGCTGSDMTEATQQQQLSLVELTGTWGCVSEQDTMGSSQGKPLPHVLCLPLVCINKTFPESQKPDSRIND